LRNLRSQAFACAGRSALRTGRISRLCCLGAARDSTLTIVKARSRLIFIAHVPVVDPGITISLSRTSIVNTNATGRVTSASGARMRRRVSQTVESIDSGIVRELNWATSFPGYSLSSAARPLLPYDHATPSARCPAVAGLPAPGCFVTSRLTYDAAVIITCAPSLFPTRPQWIASAAKTMRGNAPASSRDDGCVRPAPHSYPGLSSGWWQLTPISPRRIRRLPRSHQHQRNFARSPVSQETNMFFGDAGADAF